MYPLYRIIIFPEFSYSYIPYCTVSVPVLHRVNHEIELDIVGTFIYSI